MNRPNDLLHPLLPPGNTSSTSISLDLPTDFSIRHNQRSSLPHDVYSITPPNSLVLTSMRASEPARKSIPLVSQKLHRSRNSFDEPPQPPIVNRFKTLSERSHQLTQHARVTVRAPLKFISRAPAHGLLPWWRLPPRQATIGRG